MKNLKIQIVLILNLLAMLVLADVPVQAISNASAGIGIEASKDRHVIEALALMYAPTSNKQLDWQASVCERMTAGGCGYFINNLETMLWQHGQDVALNSAVLDEVVATLDDGSQVWKAGIIIYANCGAAALKNCTPLNSDLYLHVVHDRIQDKWLLNRVLYGPYIEEQ